MPICSRLFGACVSFSDSGPSKTCNLARETLHRSAILMLIG
jgi:hypothetical protein